MFALSLALGVIQPYRKKLHNRIEVFLYLLAAWLALIFVLVTYVFAIEPQKFYKLFINNTTVLLSVFPFFYGLVGVTCIVLPRRFTTMVMRMFSHFWI